MTAAEHLDWRESKRKKDKARAKRMAARAAKQVVQSDAGSTTASAETQAEKFKGKTVKVVQGGLPGAGKGSD